MVEPQPSKLMTRVRFPLPAPGSAKGFAHVAQLVEHTLGKGEVSSSNLLMSSMYAVGGFLSRLFLYTASEILMVRGGARNGEGKV
jgi:N-acetylglucosamine kinase-like BadF-type ATPase